MRHLSNLYKQNLSFLTDFYQITMAYSAWKSGQANKVGVFDLYFRQNPFQGGYAVHAGLATVLDFIDQFRFDEIQCEYLRTLKGRDGHPLFEEGFLQFLLNMKLNLDVDAIPEGRLIFAGEPLYRVSGPILQCQLIETPLLNFVNFETLIATKGSRVKEAAGLDPVLEFGLRRAQGVDGGLSASRAAFIGGVDGTSNMLAGQFYGIPVRGTHAHSWVMSFEDEIEAFQDFAEAMPNNCTLLVDTYDTIEGVKNAIAVGLRLKSKGHQLQGIRLDSGDLAYLSIEARKLLDAAGLTEVKIVASNDLDENIIQSLKSQGARIDIWAVGTKLVTAYDQPALGGVFKLVAMKSDEGHFVDRIKISEQASKTTNPGIHQVRRFYADGVIVGDMIYDLRSPPAGELTMIHPLDPTQRKIFDVKSSFEDLLVPVVRNGKSVYPSPSLSEIRKVRESEIAKLHPSIRRFTFPHTYPVGLEAQLHAHKMELILKHRERIREAQAYDFSI